MANIIESFPAGAGGSGGSYTAGDGIVIDNNEISVDELTENDLQDLKDAFNAVNKGQPARMFNYSTDEQIIGTWIDGKLIYQKTVNCGALPNATTKQVAHNISNLGTLVNLLGSACDGTAWLVFNYPHGNSVGNVSFVSVSVTSSNIAIKDLTNLSSFTESYITLQYTKTTD